MMFFGFVSMLLFVFACICLGVLIGMELSESLTRKAAAAVAKEKEAEA